MRLSFSISETKKPPSFTICISDHHHRHHHCHERSASRTCLTISVSVSDRSRLTAESGILTSPRRPQPNSTHDSRSSHSHCDEQYPLLVAHPAACCPGLSSPAHRTDHLPKEQPVQFYKRVLSSGPPGHLGSLPLCNRSHCICNGKKILNPTHHLLVYSA